MVTLAVVVTCTVVVGPGWVVVVGPGWVVVVGPGWVVVVGCVVGVVEGGAVLGGTDELGTELGTELGGIEDETHEEPGCWEPQLPPPSRQSLDQPPPQPDHAGSHHSWCDFFLLGFLPAALTDDDHSASDTVAVRAPSRLTAIQPRPEGSQLRRI